ncbi:unnamed protein product, partial [Tilletia laevis]
STSTTTTSSPSSRTSAF